MKIKIEQANELKQLVRRNNLVVLNFFVFIYVNLIFVAYWVGFYFFCKWFAGLRAAKPNVPVDVSGVILLFSVAVLTLNAILLYTSSLFKLISALIFGKNYAKNSTLTERIENIDFQTLYKKYFQNEINSAVDVQFESTKNNYFEKIIISLNENKFTFTFKVLKQKINYFALMCSLNKLVSLSFWFIFSIFAYDDALWKYNKKRFGKFIKYPIYEVLFVEKSYEVIYSGSKINVFKPFFDRIKFDKEIVNIENQLNLIVDVVKKEINS